MVLVKTCISIVAVLLMAVFAVREMGASVDAPVVWHYASDGNNTLWLIDLDEALPLSLNVELPSNFVSMQTFDGQLYALTTTTITQYRMTEDDFVPIDFPLAEGENLVLARATQDQVAVITEQSGGLTTIYLTNFTTTRTLYRGPLAMRYLVWSPDETWFTAVVFSDRVSYIYQVDAETGEITLLHELADVVVSLDIHPSGELLAVGMVGREYSSAVLLLPVDAVIESPTSVNTGFYGTWMPEGIALLILGRDGNLRIVELNDDLSVDTVDFVPTNGLRTANISRIEWINDTALLATYDRRLEHAYVYELAADGSNATIRNDVVLQRGSDNTGTLTTLAVADAPFAGQYPCLSLGVGVLLALGVGALFRR